MAGTMRSSTVGSLTLPVLLKAMVKTPLILPPFSGSSVKGGDGEDIFSASGAISESFIYGNSANDTLFFAAISAMILGGSDDDSVTIGGNATSVSIEGGTGADSIFAGAPTSSTIWATANSKVVGADSISLSGVVSALPSMPTWQ